MRLSQFQESQDCDFQLFMTSPPWFTEQEVAYLRHLGKNGKGLLVLVPLDSAMLAFLRISLWCQRPTPHVGTLRFSRTAQSVRCRATFPRDLRGPPSDVRWVFYDLANEPDQVSWGTTEIQV
jgi:hypothetical protein